jgi:putative ubiquitin-RnfH superfamily antitoxin RatB of RatAB toxin-antitoxin module
MTNEELTSSEHSLKKILVEVIYPLPNQQKLFEIVLPQGSDILKAIEDSKILDVYPEINLDQNKVGIFGKVCKLTDILQDNDRVEIYRPLVADPKEARKNRALKKK